MSEQMNNAVQVGRKEVLTARIEQLKKESVDYQFNQYLDQTLANLQMPGANMDQIERLMEQNYQLYLRRNGAKLGMPTQPVQPQVQQAQPVQPQKPVQPQQPVSQPVKAEHRTLEFKVGTVVLGVVGIAFLLVALVSLGIMYMSTLLQGCMLYVLCAAILVFSEVYLAKKLEKFSYIISGLGVAGMYVTTILDFVYLKIFPSWVALIITIVVTLFFLWFSYKKDSGLLRLICFIGCYVSLVPLGDFKNVAEFAIPAIIVFVINLAGYFCPLKSKNTALDYIQYIATLSLTGYLSYLLYVSGLPMWPLYILICAHIFTLHLVCLKRTEKVSYQILYIAFNIIFNIFLLSIGHHENWMGYGIIGVAAMCTFFMFLFNKTKLRFAPYIFTAIYVFLAFAMEDSAFNFTLACLLIFTVNRLLAVVAEEFKIPDAIYTMIAALCVCFFTRDGDVQLLGYVFACVILVSAFFVKYYKKYHMYTALTFAWIFLLSEHMYPLACSVLLSVLAAAMIGGGFMIKDKVVRVYGLGLIIFVSIKLALYDFKDSESLTKIIVYAIVGVVILGVSFLYIVLEKRQSDLMEAAAKAKELAVEANNAEAEAKNDEAKTVAEAVNNEEPAMPIVTAEQEVMEMPTATFSEVTVVESAEAGVEETAEVPTEEVTEEVTEETAEAPTEEVTEEPAEEEKEAAEIKDTTKEIADQTE